MFYSTGIVHTPYPEPELRFFPEREKTDNPPTIEGVEIGRFLFYDPILSIDSTISCSSCHKQTFAFSDGGNSFSAGVNGGMSKRSTMPLFNLAWNKHFFWDGKSSSIEEQVFHPVRSDIEMGLDWKVAEDRIRRSSFYRTKFKEYYGDNYIDSVRISAMIGQFERALISAESKYDRVLKGIDLFTEQEYQGYSLMNNQMKGNCINCHDTDGDVLATNLGFSNNGLDNYKNASDYVDVGKAGITGQDKDVGLFKVSSLRNIAVTAPYMHDGRFGTLEEVLDFYSEGLQNSYNIDPKMGYHYRQSRVLSREEKDAIISFLHTLTDSSFLSNPGFANPFLK